MSPPRQDRRVQRTKCRLKDALLALIRQRGYERITVHDIARKAEVGRSTFYSHFDSKDELLFDGFGPGLRGLARHAPPTGGAGFRFSLPLLRHIADQKRFALATLRGGPYARIRRQTTAIFADVVRAELERMDPPRGGADEARAREAQVQAVVGAFMGLATWWLSSDTRMTVEEVDAVFQRVAAPAVSGAGKGRG
jgi:AcrR family transcriptional regulator